MQYNLKQVLQDLHNCCSHHQHFVLACSQWRRTVQSWTVRRHWLQVQAKTKCWWWLQQLCKSCRTCFKFYCMFYFTCDRSFTVVIIVALAMPGHATETLLWICCNSLCLGRIFQPLTSLDLTSYTRLVSRSTTSNPACLQVWQNEIPWIYQTL